MDESNSSNDLSLDPKSKEILARLDERTERMDKRLDGLAKEVETNTQDIDELQGSVRRNTTVLGGFATGVSGLVIWISDKVTRVI